MVALLAAHRKNLMTKFQTWVLRKIFAKLFIQGPNHQFNVTQVYELIRETWREEFTEDNRATTDIVLREAFNATQSDVKDEDFTPTVRFLCKKLLENKGHKFK